MCDSAGPKFPAGRRVLQRALAVGIVHCFFPALAVHMASAGVWVVETGKDFRSGVVLIRNLRLEADRASIDIRDGKQHTTVIYQSDPRKVWMIDHQQRFYRVLGDESLSALKEQLSGVRAEMSRRAEEQLAAMTEEQRRALTQPMRERAAGRSADTAGDTAATEFTQVWGGESVNEWKCDKYEGSRNGQKVWDVCAVPLSRLGVQRSDFAAFSEAIGYLSSLRLWKEGSVAEPGGVDWKKRKSYPGFPVQRIRYENGRTAEVFELREIEQREFSASDFEAPKNYMERAVLMFTPETFAAEPSGDKPE